LPHLFELLLELFAPLAFLKVLHSQFLHFATPAASVSAISLRPRDEIDKETRDKKSDGKSQQERKNSLDHSGKTHINTS
jgi:hypothetical protein